MNKKISLLFIICLCCAFAFGFILNNTVQIQNNNQTINISDKIFENIERGEQ